MDPSRKIANARALAQQLGREGDVLTSRHFGSDFLVALKALLSSTPLSSILVLSFDGVEFMDGSFPDEVFATLSAARSRREIEASPMVLVDVNESCLDSLQYALQSRPEREKNLGLRNCALPLQENEGDRTSLTLVGKWEDHVEQTFEILRTEVTLNARQLADTMKLSIPAASTRLKVLYDLGLALRSEMRDAQGKQFVYHWIG